MVRADENRLVSTTDIDSTDIFEPLVWGEPLEKFAQALGITISLYDHQGTCRGVISPGPVGEYLSRIGFLAEGGGGAAIDRSSALACVATGAPIFSVEYEIFAHLSIPLLNDGDAVAAFVLGWIPERFADPVACDAFAKRVEVPAMELWKIMRMQQPLGRSKLDTYGKLLETFTAPLMRQLMAKAENLRRVERSVILAECTAAIAAARGQRALADALFNGLARLMPGAVLQLHLPKTPADGELITYRDRALDVVNPAVVGGLRTECLRISIPTDDDSARGVIEITYEAERFDEDQIRDVRALAAHLGTALSRAALIDALEAERAALSAANDQLRHLHQMKDEFLATVSHELRTPLTAILGWAQLLESVGPEDVDFGQGMTTIRRNAENQRRLIEDLLDVSRIISGKMHLIREPLEASALLAEALETVRPMTEARRQTVHLTPPGEPIYFRGDGTRFSQILWNLLSNASKFTPEGGDIFVELRRRGHYFDLSVIDTGKGIEAEFLPNLFDRFSQADGSYSRRHGGLGLGLAIVRHLVELHGGTVRATSAGRDRGAAFTVTLPQNTTEWELDSAQSLSGTLEPAAAEAIDLRDVRILLIDDEPDALRLVKFVLEKRGALVELANTVAEGLSLVRVWHPHVLVSDISMPGETGFDLIRRVRELSSADGGETPAIALTAMSGSDVRIRTLGAGFQLHISKPLEPSLLYDGVRMLIDQAHAVVTMH